MGLDPGVNAVEPARRQAFKEGAPMHLSLGEGDGDAQHPAEPLGALILPYAKAHNRHREAALAAVAIQKQLRKPMLLDCFAALSMTKELSTLLVAGIAQSPNGKRRGGDRSRASPEWLIDGGALQKPLLS